MRASGSGRVESEKRERKTVRKRQTRRQTKGRKEGEGGTTERRESQKHQQLSQGRRELRCSRSENQRMRIDLGLELL